MEEKHNKTFYLYGGKTVSSLKGFAKELASMSKEVYEHHVTPHKNDFSNWISFSLNKKSLSEKIEGQISKVEMELEILRELVHSAQVKSPRKKVVKAASKVKKAVKKTVKKSN